MSAGRTERIWLAVEGDSPQARGSEAKSSLGSARKTGERLNRDEARQGEIEVGAAKEKQANTSGVYLNARKTGRIKERNGI